MGDPIELDIAAIPLGPSGRRLAAQRARVTRQRRLRPDGLQPDDSMGATVTPARSNPDGLSAADITAQTEERLQGLAGDITRAAGEGLAQQPPANPFDAQQPTDAALARLNPQQLSRVQTLPVSGQYEDDPSNDEAIIGAAAREMGTPMPPSTQLRAPMSGPAPTSSTPLRAPGVMDDLAPPDEQAGEDAAAWGQVEDDLMGMPASTFAMPTSRAAAQDPRDAADMRQAQRLNRAQRGLSIGSAILSVLGDIGAGDTGNRFSSAPALAGIASNIDSNAPIARMNARHQAAADAEQQQFERAMLERRAGLDERRIAQGEAATAQRAGYRDADIDPNHQNAENERQSYEVWFSGLPEHIREAFPGYNPANPNVRQRLSQMGAAQIRHNLELLNEQAMVRFPDEADWKNTGRVGGGRAARGSRFSTSTPGRTVQRGDAGVTPEQLLQMDAAGVDELPVEPAPRTQGGGAPRARGGGQRTQGGGALRRATTPTPTVLYQRAPTDEEIAQDPSLAYHEELIRAAALRAGVDVNTPRGRAVAATYADRRMGEGAEDQLMMSGGAQRQRTPEQQRQVETFVQRYGPSIGREQQLHGLGSELNRALEQPSGDAIVRAALHLNGGIPEHLAASSSEVTRLRGLIYSYLNRYFSDYGGANVTANEMMRYRAAFAAGAINANPREFLRAIRQSRDRERGELDQGRRAFPEGHRLYFEDNGGAQ